MTAGRVRADRAGTRTRRRGRPGRGRQSARSAFVLALGLVFRLIIATASIPDSGFGVDLSSFQFWAGNLADKGLHGFYERDFFHDYTPGYLYVLCWSAWSGGPPATSAT